MLVDKVAIVTGASRGIGAAAARAFAAAGAAVALAARNADALESLVAEIGAAGGRAIAVPTDVTDETAVAELCGAPSPRSAAWTLRSTTPAAELHT